MKMDTVQEATTVVSLAHSQKIVNDVLASFLHQQRTAAQSIHPSYERLYAEIERVVFAGGKRLRPHLVFVGYGSYDDSIAKVAAAHELLHVALLVHDDIIDRDITRHGQATIHHQYESVHYAPHLSDETDRRHFSTSAALLAGDLLISSAYELIRQAKLNEDGYQKATQFLSTGIFEVAGGELLDTEAPFVPEGYPPILVYRYKTTGYSFISPLLTGAALSDANTLEDVEFLREYATKLGIAYQIKDDYLGVFGETETTGKSTFGDLREGKQTALIEKFRERASPAQQELFENVFGNAESSDESLSLLKRAIEDSGALAETTRLEHDYIDGALKAAEQIQNPELRENLTQLITVLNIRKS